MKELMLKMEEISSVMVQSLDNSLGIWYYIILNAFGIIAILFKVSEFQLKNRKQILLFATFACFSWVLYFGLQGGFTSALSCLIMAIMTIVFSQREKHKWANSIFWLILFIALQLGMFFLTARYWFDVLPAIAGVISAVAYYVLDENKYRVLIFFYVILWVINSFINLYVISMISDSLSTISSSIAIIRYNILKKGNTKNTEPEQKANQAG